MDMMMTFSCSTLLCFRWWSRTTGAPPGSEVMKTATPWTRDGLRRGITSTESGQGAAGHILQEQRQRERVVVEDPNDGLAPPLPGGHEDINYRGHQQREPAALCD